MDRLERHHYDDKADWLRRRIGLLLPQGGRVLDVGAGSGANLKLARKIGATHVTALEPDISDDSRENFDEADELIEADLHTLATTEGVEEYDTVLAMNVQIIGDEEQFIAEIAQLLKDQGTAIFSFAERERMNRLVPHIQKHFSEMQVHGKYYDQQWGPDHIVIVAKKNGAGSNEWSPREIETVDPWTVPNTAKQYGARAFDTLVTQTPPVDPKEFYFPSDLFGKE